MMMDFTDAWGWPQWAIVIWAILALCFNASAHGREMRVEAGERKGEVRRYSFHIALIRCALIFFVLIAGGFFA